MNELVKLKKKIEIKTWLDNHKISKYIINKDFTVDVDGSVNLGNCKMDKLPFKFGRVSRSFICAECGLTTLKGCPSYVGFDFICSLNLLTSLKYCPKEVGGDFHCDGNKETFNKIPKGLKFGGSFFSSLPSPF